MKRHILSRFAILAGSIFLAGCSNQPEMAKVKGTVTLDGKPLAAGTVTFEAKGTRPATARVVNGEITEVTTFKTNDGVPVGSHKVAVTASEDLAATSANPGDKSPKGNYMVGKSLIPTAYNDPDKSKLTAEIKPGENTVEFKLFSSGPK